MSGARRPHAADWRRIGTRICPLRNVSCRSITAASALWLAGCTGVQSALDPAGREAERIANLFWWMAAGAVVIWVAVVGLALYCARARSESFSRRWASWAIIGGGAAVPTAVLAILLIFGLALLPG